MVSKILQNIVQTCSNSWKSILKSFQKELQKELSCCWCTQQTLWDEPNDLISNVPNDLGFNVPNDPKWRKNQKVFNQTLITFCHFKISKFWQMRSAEKWTAHKTYISEFPDWQNFKNYRHLKLVFPGGAPPKWPIFSRLRSYQSMDFKISFRRW